MDDDYGGSGKLQTLWNFDDEELRLVFAFKQEFITHLRDTNLESAYWALRDMYREVDAKFSDKEREDFLDKLQSLEAKRIEWGSTEDDSRTIKQSEFYLELENFYLEMCRMLAEYGVYFRSQQEDDGL